MPEYKLRVSDELHQRVEGARCGVPRERWLRGVIEAALDEGPVRRGKRTPAEEPRPSVPGRAPRRAPGRRLKELASLDVAAVEVLKDRVEAAAVELSRADAFRAAGQKRGKS